MIDFNMDLGVSPPPAQSPRRTGPGPDPLLEVLRAVRLDCAAFHAVEAGGTWCVMIESAQRLAPRLMPRARHLISCHILTEGRCFVGLPGERPVELAAGDLVLFPHGDRHLLSGGPDRGIGLDLFGGSFQRDGETTVVGDGGPRSAGFLSGLLGWDLPPGNPLFVALPRMMVARATTIPWLGAFARQTMAESRQGQAGADSVLARLGELLFIEMIRRHLEQLPPEETGWYAGLRDATVGRALALLHAQPGHPWTLADLARQVSSSRSRLTERFTSLIGQPPMQYLTQWRMQIAANRLLESDAKVAAVGSEVAYGSEAAFNRAFKRATGASPGAWRELRRGARA